MQQNHSRRLFGGMELNMLTIAALFDVIPLPARF